MLYLQNLGILPKNYLNSTRNATTARYWKSWLKKTKFLVKNQKYTMVEQKYV